MKLCYFSLESLEDEEKYISGVRAVLIQKKLATWKTSMLSMAGRVCLVKSVISTIPMYSMQAFWLPRGILGRIDQVMRPFVQ